jgi:hypothetical protein
LVDEQQKKIFVSSIGIKYVVKELENKKNTIVDCFLSIEEIFQKYNSLNLFFSQLKKINEKVIIYADEKNYLILLTSWLKSLLKNPNEKKIFFLIKSLLFRDNIFNNSRFNFKEKKDKKIYCILNEKKFKEIYDNSYVENVDILKSYVGVEYLLTTFLYDGSFKEELKCSMKNLIRRDLVKYLFELKEIFLVHLRTKSFTKKLNLSKEYDFSNFYDILTDDSKFSKVFTNPNIWKKPFKTIGNHIDSIQFENITLEDIDTFKEFTVISGSSWVEESCYIFMKSDVNKLDFLPCFNNFTDNLLNKIIEAESTFDHSSGSFFSIDLSTVNHYFIQTVLENKNNKDFLKNYIL